MTKVNYLIDFENVGVYGLAGAENLNSNDYVHLFSTKNAPKITTATLSNFNSTHLIVHEVPAKNQSVDMHLVSYLGYLLGSEGASSEYYIISKDRDYLNIINFWKLESNITINCRVNLLGETTATTNYEPMEKEEIKLNNFNVNKERIQREMESLGYSNNDIEKVISIVTNDESDSDYLLYIHNELQKNFELSQRIEIFKVIKSAIIRGPSPISSNKQSSNSNSISEINMEVQKILSKAKINNDIIGRISSIVSKNYSKKFSKQIIYTLIIKEFGETQGLYIYNHIKKLLN